MKKINLKGISEVLSEKEMKNVMGGSIQYNPLPDPPRPGWGNTGTPCWNNFECFSGRCVGVVSPEILWMDISPRAGLCM